MNSKKIEIVGLNQTQVAVVGLLIEEIKKQVKPFEYQKTQAQRYIDLNKPRYEFLLSLELTNEISDRWVTELETEIKRNEEIIVVNQKNIEFIEKRLSDIYKHIKETITETDAIFEYDTEYFSPLLDFAVLFVQLDFKDEEEVTE